jgi:hypothetical protein
MWETIPNQLANEILDGIEKGNSLGQRYSAAANAGVERAAWQVVKVMAPNLTDKQCRTVINNWQINGVIETRLYDDPKRRKEDRGLFVNDAKRPT